MHQLLVFVYLLTKELERVQYVEKMSFMCEYK